VTVVTDDIIEEIARAWASIDGKAELFDRCKADQSSEDEFGHFEGYMSEARELVNRSPQLSAILSASPAPVAAGDWVMVPRTLTGKMREAAWDAVGEDKPDDYQQHLLTIEWKAIIAAAPAHVAADNKEFDGTDFAHPAWWRGNDAGVETTVNIVNDVLDGKKTGAFGYEALNDLVDRIRSAPPHVDADARRISQSTVDGMVDGIRSALASETEGGR
jgi:hypothetical protein